MVGYVRNRRHLSYFKRPILIAAVIPYYLCVGIPLQVFSDRIPLEISSFKDEDFDQFILKFDKIKNAFNLSNNRNLESIKAIQGLLEELNFNCDTNFSIEDLFVVAKSEISKLNMSEADQLNKVICNLEETNLAAKTIITETVYREVSISEKKSPHSLQQAECCIYAPWTWAWFGLNKKKHKHKHKVALVSLEINYPGPIPVDDGTIPDDLIICGVEALVIGLLLIIPSGYTQALALAISYDMLSRGSEALKQLSDQNKSAQNLLFRQQSPSNNAY